MNSAKKGSPKINPESIISNEGCSSLQLTVCLSFRRYLTWAKYCKPNDPPTSIVWNQKKIQLPLILTCKPILHIRHTSNFDKSYKPHRQGCEMKKMVSSEDAAWIDDVTLNPCKLYSLTLLGGFEGMPPKKILKI